MREQALRLCPQAELDALPEGRARGFAAGDDDKDRLFVVRYQGRLHAWRNACPHIDGAAMAWRRDAYMNAAGTHIVCAAHGATFEPDSGRCVQGPCAGLCLTPVALSRDAAGLAWAQ